MKAIILAIQPYYVFLIIAWHMGWDIPQHKTEEVRKDFPKDIAWNKIVHIYCSKDRKSFNRIPKQYRSLMAKFLGKVIGEFVCDYIRKGGADNLVQAYYHNNPDETCLTDQELVIYANLGEPLFFWHISDLKICDKPKELSEFRTRCRISCFSCKNPLYSDGTCEERNVKKIVRPPQSWCYVEARG